jgi:hypothetical protein
MNSNAQTPATPTTWRTSSYSSATGQCVEVAHATTTVAVRDSKQSTDRPTLAFGPQQWAAFTRSLTPQD